MTARITLGSLRSDALAWVASPQGRQMASLGRRLERTPEDGRLLSALVHEAMLARRLVALGFSVRSEVSNSRGRSCDIEARRGETALHFHVKCLHVDSPGKPRARISIPRCMQRLEKIPRRLLVEIEWTNGLSPRALDLMALQMERFLLRGAVGDEFVARGPRGRLYGRCRIRSPRDQRGVALIQGVHADREQTIARIAKLLERAHEQFLPGGLNIIVIFGPDEARWLFEQALLGTPVQRWDAFPRHNEAVALGRAGNGFWRPLRRDSSRVAAWATVMQPEGEWTAWVRPPVPAAEMRACRELFAKVIEHNGSITARQVR